MTIPRMSTQELKDFVLNYCDSKIYTSFDCNIDDVRNIFLVLGFIELEEEVINDIGCLWEHIGKAGPMSCDQKGTEET